MILTAGWSEGSFMEVRRARADHSAIDLVVGYRSDVGSTATAVTLSPEQARSAIEMIAEYLGLEVTIR